MGAATPVPRSRVLLNGARLDDTVPPEKVTPREGDQPALLMPVMGG